MHYIRSNYTKTRLYSGPINEKVRREVINVTSSLLEIEDNIHSIYTVSA